MKASQHRYDLVVIGTSTGGLDALGVLLRDLPAEYALPIAIVQHRSKESNEVLAHLLQVGAQIPVREAEDKEPLMAPGAYIGPSDYHLLVEPRGLALSTDEPVAFSRPSIDVLFESAADAYGPGVIGVLLTGANHDGTRGLQRIKAAGGYVIVQDPKTAACPVMPQNGLANVQVDQVLELREVAQELVNRAQGMNRGAEP